MHTERLTRRIWDAENGIYVTVDIEVMIDLERVGASLASRAWRSNNGIARGGDGILVAVRPRENGNG